jgi:hypothetical protein
MAAGFGQWKDVTPDYRGFPSFEIPRKHPGMDGKEYASPGASRVHDSMKLARDGKNLYVYLRAFDTPAAPGPEHSTYMLLRVQAAGHGYDPDDRPSWEGYHFIFGKVGMDSASTIMHECLGGWRWRACATVLHASSGREMQAAIPLSALGLEGAEHFELQFKWVNWSEESESAEDFYLNGCAAPYGRGSFVYRV